MAVHKKPLMTYFQKTKTGSGLIVNCESMQVFVPERYSVHDLMVVGANIRALGIFQIKVSEEAVPYNLLLPAMLNMFPSSTKEQVIDEIPYLVLTFVKGDMFIDSMTIIKQNFIISKIFIEFMRNGNMPTFLTYSQMATIFDTAQTTCGANLSVPHATLEMMVAHCARYPADLNLKYRFSKMDKTPVFLGLRNTTNVRDSATSKLVGSYVMDGINSAIVNQSDHRSEVEDLLRT